VKRVAFCTFGCRLNQYDTETMRTLLADEGDWRTVPFDEEADVYVVNTCSVTARADSRARNMIRRIHGERPGARIVATGCYAQRAPEDLAKLPGVSLVLGAADRERVVSELADLKPGAARMAVSPITAATTFHEVPITEMMDRSRAFVKVQEGCDESCTFCIIPKTRGRSRSRRPDAVLDQVRALVGSGYTEIVITGVHVGDYGLDLAEGRRLLPELIAGILALPGLERFRLSSIEPSTVTDELIGLMAGEERFARHFHIPFQSGSDEILERMNRRYRAAEFGDLLERIADQIPGCGIGTDVICGFPGETDDHFQRTFDWLERLPVTYIHAFTYSVRPGSAAESLDDHVPGDVKKRRTRALRRLSRDKNRVFRERLVGKQMPIFAEEMRVGGRPHLGGLTDNYVRVDLGPGEAERSLVPARITGVTEDGLVGERTAA
jgi:threonylcarbamoyladenosine tRNA methylthiotransferase MtaB